MIVKIITDLKDPCKKCVVRAMCSEACDKKRYHQSSLPTLVVISALCEIIALIAMWVFLYIVSLKLFPLLNCDAYAIISSIFGGFLILFMMHWDPFYD